MDRNKIKNKIIKYFREQSQTSDRTGRPKIQVGNLYALFGEERQSLQGHQHDELLTIIREIIHELTISGILYPGLPGDPQSGYPWLTITEHGKNVLAEEEWFPYDPEGYVCLLKERVPNLDDVTLAYIGEAVNSFNMRCLLSATLTLGVASENLMLLLIESYTSWISDSNRKSKFEGKIQDKFIYAKYKEFKEEFGRDIKILPKELQGDWETYLEGIFNFIRLNRNKAGHPTGKKLDAKVVYASLQIFAEYTNYVFCLIDYFSEK